MLSREDNELLTRVGPGTPMGDLMRRYWIPALLSEEVAERDGSPVRVRLLGEDLVAFRDTEGRLGLLAEHCSHRRASLFYGRNEECGLRCIYHGWKYDADGNVVDTPAEPPSSQIKNKVSHPAYPTKEANGFVFTYMGPKEKMPLFPNYEWLTAPPEHVAPISKVLNECSWLNGIEGECDSSHLNFLHRGNDPKRLVFQTIGPPSFEIEYRPYGLRAAAIRMLNEGQQHFRTSCFIMPCVAGVSSYVRKVNGRMDGFSAVYHVPADDVSEWKYHVSFTRTAPVTEAEREARRRANRLIGSDHRKVANRGNEYLIDRQKQKAGAPYTGIESFAIQDACVTESMGVISDRTRENLGLSDAYLLGFRRFLLKAVKEFQAGIDPPGLVWNSAENNFPDVNCIDEAAPLDARWQPLLERR